MDEIHLDGTEISVPSWSGTVCLCNSRISSRPTGQPARSHGEPAERQYCLHRHHGVDCAGLSVHPAAYEQSPGSLADRRDDRLALRLWSNHVLFRHTP